VTGARAIVLLHGFRGRCRSLATITQRLAERLPSLTVTALDLLGHGGARPLPPGADLGTLARAAFEDARGLGLPEPFALVGHSLGGRVALRAGLLERAAIAHATLLDIGPSPLRADHETGRILEVLLAAPDAAPSRDAFRRHFRAAGLADEITEWLLLNLEPGDSVYRGRIDRPALAALRERTAGEDLWAAVEEPHAYSLHCVRRAVHVRERRGRAPVDRGRLSRRYDRGREPLPARRATGGGRRDHPRSDAAGAPSHRIALRSDPIMPPTSDRLERLRARLTATINRGTDLIADLKSVDEWLQLVMPSLADLPNDERERYVARLCGYDQALPDKLRELVESLADVLAGLTNADGGQAWLRHQPLEARDGRGRGHGVMAAGRDQRSARP
jgi:esterase